MISSFDMNMKKIPKVHETVSLLCATSVIVQLHLNPAKRQQK